MTKKQEEQGKPRRMFLKAKSTFGSSFHIPNTDPHVPPNSPFSGLEIPWNRWVVISEMWKDNPYLQAAVEAGKVILDESYGAPEPPPDMPVDLLGEHKEWLKAFLYGPYTNGFKQQLKDWQDRALVVRDKGRQTILLNNVLPVLRAAYELEPRLQNRNEVMKDILACIDFINKREWENIPEKDRRR